MANRWGTMETVTDFIFLGSKITADGECSHEIKKHLLLERKTMTNLAQFSSVQFSCSVVSNSLRPHESQHARPPCPSPTPRVYPNPCPLSQRCHRTILSSVVPFSSCLQSFLALESFPMSWLYSSSGQSIEASALASVLLDRLVWSPCCQRDSQEYSPAPQFKSTNSLALSLLYGPTLTSLYDYWKSHSFAYMDLACQSDFSVF